MNFKIRIVRRFKNLYIEGYYFKAVFARGVLFFTEIELVGARVLSECFGRYYFQHQINLYFCLPGFIQSIF
jgi:hypothetical protein